MATYAVISYGTVTNIVEAEEDFASANNWVLIPQGYGIGDKYENGVFKKFYEPIDPSTNTGNL